MHRPTAIVPMNSDELRAFQKNRPESTYTIVDVRTDGEYAKGHIPGAKHLPITQLPARLGELNPELDTVFHCHSGVRSRRAAHMAVESGLLQGQIYDFSPGIAGWNGQTLPQKPPLKDFFDPDDTPRQALEKALQLEKGAWNFYTGLVDDALGGPTCGLLEQLAEAKREQARTLHRELVREAPTQNKSHKDFVTFFEALDGEMLQSGDPVSFLSEWASVSRIDCLNAAEVALELEYRAYDLYKNMGSACPRPEVENAFTMLAHAQRELIATIQEFMDLQSG